MAGLTAVPPAELATIVTTLEMRQRPPLRPMPASLFRLTRWRAPGLDRYRTLFRRVGARWLWYSRLVLADEALAAILADPAVEVFAATDPTGIEIGMVELDHRTPGTCTIAYFALVPELAGQGHGRWLMAETLARAWRPGVERVRVNTCTLDHPRALGFYRAQGFAAVARAVETFPDPRAIGLLPIDAAPQIPLLARQRGV